MSDAIASDKELVAFVQNLSKTDTFLTTAF